MLKLHSEWEAKNGITHPVNIETLRKWTGFSKATVIDKIKDLQAAGMLQRLSKRWERSVFQLYPKPRTEPRAQRRRKKHAQKKGSDKNAKREMRADGKYRFSFNEKYRLDVTTGDIDVREGYRRGVWKRASDYHIAQVMYPSTREAFSNPSTPIRP